MRRALLPGDPLRPHRRQAPHPNARQGAYARDPQILAGNPPANLGIAAIGDLRDYDVPTLLAAATGVASPR